MEVREFQQIISRHVLMITLLCLSATINAALITYAISEKYQATALVLVRPREEIHLGGTDPNRRNILNFPLGINMPHEAPSKTFTELIKSRKVAEQIVRNLGLDKIKRAPEQSHVKEMWELFKEDTKEVLAKAWDILRYGRLMEPDRFNKEVEDVQKNISVKPTNKSFVFELSCLWKDPGLARDIVNETARAFVGLLAEFSEREAKGGREFIELQWLEAERKLAQSRKALQEFKEQNKSILFIEEATEKIKALSELETSLEKTNAELSGLLEQLMPSHPKVRKLQAEVDSLTASITLKKRGLESLPEKEARLAALKLRVKSTETAYEFITREYEEARIREAKRSIDIGVVAPAFASQSPVKPIKIYYAGTAFFMALLVGIASVLIIESLNTTLRNIDEVESSLGLPVLTTIPSIRSQLSVKLPVASRPQSPSG